MRKENQFETLYEDGHIIVCIKPAGVPVETRKTGTPDMLSLLRNYFSPSKAPHLSIIHRLDQPVEGLLVFAKTLTAARALNRQLQEDGFGKEYLAVTCGFLPHSSGKLTDYLVKDGRNNLSQVCPENKPLAKYAELSYQVTAKDREANLSLVHVTLKTGRHHQIRVQLAHAGAPLWGDSKYNPEFVHAPGYHPIALCAFRLRFLHPVSRKPLEFEIIPHGPGFTHFMETLS